MPDLSPRPDTHERGQVAVQLSLFLAAFFIVWSLRATVFFALDERIASPTGRAAYSSALKMILWVLPAVAYASWLRPGPAVRYLGLSIAPGARTWLACAAVTVAFLLVVGLVDTTLGGKTVSLAGLQGSPGMIFGLQFFLSPLLEEILFRGLVMKELLILLPTYWASAMTSVLFVGAHLPYWLAHGGLTGSTIADAGGVFLFSLLACWLYARSRSVWPSVAAHVANNLLSALLISGGAHTGTR